MPSWRPPRPRCSTPRPRTSPPGCGPTWSPASRARCAGSRSTGFPVTLPRWRSPTRRPRSLTQARAHHDRVTARLAELTAALDGSDGPDALTATLQAIEALTARARQAAAAVREARERHRRARAAEDHTHSAVRDAWRSFDRVRDELRRLAERREQAAALRDQLAEHTARAQVAKALANHLKSTNFERWLLEEALDLLVGGASEILRQLSGGQYDLVHDKGEFVVV